MIFKDRQEAGKKLAEKLLKYKDENPIVLSLPRGGVPVGHEIAEKLKCPSDVFIVRKLGVPFQPELGMGAIAENGVYILNERLVQNLQISESQIQEVLTKELAELKRRVNFYRGGNLIQNLKNKTVILVDDGLATGISARAAIKGLRELQAKKIILAVPVGAAESVEDLKLMVDELICLYCPDDFSAVGEWYEDFTQVSDEEVRMLT